MSSRGGLWRRWKRLAHRAAVVQSHALLFLIYFVVVVPIGALRRLASDPLGRGVSAPAWRVRPRAGADGVEAARRQF
jgi:hypothetical protein